MLAINLVIVEANPKLSFGFETAFAEPGVVECEPVRETLHGLADLIDG